MRFTRTLSILLGLFIVACGSTVEESTTTTAADTTTTIADSTTTETSAAATTTTAGATTTAAASGPVLTVADSDLGAILADGEGNTVYLFVPDGQGEPTCTGDCAATWPPLTDSVSAGGGVDATLLGTAGSGQVTYNGWPLYYYTGDQAPGDTNGQEVGGVWFVIDPTGNPIE